VLTLQWKKRPLIKQPSLLSLYPVKRTVFGETAKLINFLDRRVVQLFGRKNRPLVFPDVLEFLRDSVSDEKPEVSEKNLASKIADELKDRLVTLKLLVYSFFF
jgi:hypothetical protein